MNKKSLYQRNAIFFQYSKSFEEYNPKMSYQIKNFGIQNIFKQFQTNKSLLSETEKNEFTKQIQEIKSMKDNLGENANVTKNEFVEFLENLFNNVDEVDREGEITMKTAGSFRLIGDLIDILSLYGPIDEDWNKKRKYCKFKCVDIAKSLKAGEVPRRGGPKENQDDDLNNELKALEKENKIVANDSLNKIQTNETYRNEMDNMNDNLVVNKMNYLNENRNHTDINSMNNKVNTNNLNNFQNNHQKNYYQIQTGTNSASHGNTKNDEIDWNRNINYQKKDPLDLQPSVSHEFTNVNVNANDLPDKIVHNLSTSVINNHSNLVQKHEAEYINQQFSSIHIVNPNKNININLNKEPNLLEFIEKQNNSSIKMPHVSPTVSNLIKPLKISLPTCKEKKEDYDKLIKTVLQHIEYGGLELDYQKISFSIDHIEMALYYLRNINKN